MRNHPNPSNPSPSFSRFIGCDVGKASLVFFQTGDAATHTIANDRASIEAFAATLDPGCLLVCEATGGYEALLLSVWTGMGRAAHRADARRVKAFIRSHGVLGKTDDIDARQLELYGKERHAILPLWQPADPNRQKLQAPKTSGACPHPPGHGRGPRGLDQPPQSPGRGQCEDPYGENPQMHPGADRRHRSRD